MKGFGEDLAVHFVGIFIVVGRKSGQHLVEKNAESPPIDRFGVTLTQQELGGEVLGGTAEGYGCLGGPGEKREVN